jgi:antitoxin component of RelBE/YafQ-DinJ toxin-antitoxin module
VGRMTERLNVRINRTEHEQARATARSLGLPTAEFTRMALRERVALEAALLRHNDAKDGGHK